MSFTVRRQVKRERSELKQRVGLQLQLKAKSLPRKPLALQLLWSPKVVFRPKVIPRQENQSSGPHRHRHSPPGSGGAEDYNWWDPKQVVSCAFHHLCCLPLEQLEQSLPIALVNCLQKSQRLLGPIGLSTQRTNESGGVVSRSRW